MGVQKYMAALKEYKDGYDTLSLGWSVIKKLPYAYPAPEILQIQREAKSKYNYRIVPLIVFDCGAILNENYMPLLNNLTQEAEKGEYDGYVIDMECGDRNYQKHHDFMAKFGSMLGGRELSWFSHGFWRPWHLLPVTWNGFCQDMDTYRHPTYGKTWVHIFSPLHAGIGLVAGGAFDNATYVQQYFEKDLFSWNATYVGTWVGIANFKNKAVWLKSSAKFLSTPYGMTGQPKEVYFVP
eukprot:TRINITY_DN67112_c1_g1_i1.p2 TRINITY_DN67112_c1_g1~~TRINITY_DN67112_c1_g1_i1.p2  ORF type:complete len:278 (-),score=30.66 TRINITY_DN67112_c1_g1_i1:1028-1741(-)